MGHNAGRWQVAGSNKGHPVRRVGGPCRPSHHGRTQPTKSRPDGGRIPSRPVGKECAPGGRWPRPGDIVRS